MCFFKKKGTLKKESRQNKETVSVNKKPLLLCIMDGFGNDKPEGNAIYSAKTPNLDRIFAEYPTTQIGASGMDVGLPDGQMGNSEVGHTNIGAGRVVYQELTRITKSIKDGDFFANPALEAAMDNCVKTGAALHLIGLVSDGGVHSHNTHLYALVEMAKKKGVEKVYCHALLDGRDVPPASGADFVAELRDKLAEIGCGEIATVMGRFYAMDRDNRWDRVEKAYAAMVYGEGVKNADPVAAIRESYEVVDGDGKNLTDEFVIPVVCKEGANVKSGDSVVFFNFRPDRAREITRTFVDPDFDGFERKNGFFPLVYVCMTQYDATMPNVSVAFKPQSLKNTFGEYISANGLTQLRIAETEKYAHVTFFFNGGVEAQYEGEDRALIASPKVATYDLKPSMSAVEVTDEVLARIASDKYDVIILNFANCDMVGHTGVFSAAVEAVETVDTCVGKVADAVLAKGGAMIITADHGNADRMVDDDGTPFTAHTTNPVPFCVAGYPCELREGGKLADIAPTMLRILGMAQPEEMDGVSIIK
ncbi:MAG: 2,3-bisphosphoglycerate-independent phosphoglycerate mutase [Ruminococcaceae bacterium]|nr:2,3-bisphosphoglycerate-independent phosphoglycerate mutase [Oscillospiraceae bacterium]